jgi:iron complex outermembrane receptor protein
MHCISNVVRTVLLSVVALKGFAATTEPEPLQPLVDIPTDIKSQPLADALTAWAQLTGYQIVVPQSKAAERITAPIKGNMTAQESLDRLLAGTGLIFERINDRTVAIHEDFSGPLPIEPDPKAQPILASLEKVEVTGTRLPMTAEDIKANGWPLTPGPVTVFSRKKLDQLGVSQTADFLDYLSQAPFRAREAQMSGQFAQARGLGFDNTLVLINGRRTLPSALSVQFNAFDLNTVPPAAVEQIEVLPDSASAVYGSDAIGGVVNIILKKNVTDTTLDLDYGTAADGGVERRAALISGYSNERFRTSLVFEYFHRDSLLGAERERWNNQDFRRFGGRDYRFVQTNPGNIRSLTTANLPGLPSPFAAVPAGSTGIGLTRENFLATAGQQNKESLYRYLSILPESQRTGATASVELDLTSGMTAFGEALYVDKTMDFQLTPERLLGAVVPATNPFNPFGVAVAVDYLFDEVGPLQRKERSKVSRALGGLRGTWSTWDWELSFLKSDDDGSTRKRNEVDMSRVAKALSATDPDQALNVFRDGPGGSAALLTSLIADARVGKYSSTGTHTSVVLRGPLFDLPAGRVQMVVGGERRTETVAYDQPNSSGAPGSVVVNGDRKVTAAFGEMRIPLVNHAMQVPAVKELSFTLAARQDRYSDFGDTFNPQYGLLWRPFADVMLRASHGTSFRAPSQFELFLPKSIISFALPDPLRNGKPANITLTAGGNPNLDPAEARSTTAGIVITPSAVPGLQFSASYWRIDMENMVNIPPLFQLAASPSDDSGRVVRAERTAEDIAAGFPGVLTHLDISRINMGDLKTSGVDIAADYTIDTRYGRIAPSVFATWVDQYETVVFPGDRPTERTGVADRSGTIPRWRFVGSLEWSLRGLNLSTTVRHTPHYRDTNSLSQILERRVHAQTLMDAQASIELESVFGERSIWSGAKVTAGISNIFDKEPSFSEVLGDLGYDPTQGDLRQRFGYIKVSKRF